MLNTFEQDKDIHLTFLQDFLTVDTCAHGTPEIPHFCLILTFLPNITRLGHFNQSRLAKYAPGTHFGQKNGIGCLFRVTNF